MSVVGGRWHAISVFVLVGALANYARAVPYEVFVDVDGEEGIYDLFSSGQVSERTFDALLLLFQTKVDLDRANRERLYALPNLDLAAANAIADFRERRDGCLDLDELVSAQVLEAELAQSIRVFVESGCGVPDRIVGFARAQVQTTGRYDRLPPATAAQVRLRAGDRLDSGLVAVVARNDVSRVRWDGLRQGLSVASERTRFVVPKLFVAWDGGTWRAIAGTYRIGFGQRLTFDVTDQSLPNGFFGDYELRRRSSLGLRCRRSAGELLVSPCPNGRDVRSGPDFAWTNRLSGAAVGSDAIRIGDGLLQVYAWGSYQVHRLSQYGVVDAGDCVNADSECATVPVYVRGGDPGAPQGALRFGTVPRVVAEGLGGIRLGFASPRVLRIGLTGYGAVPRWLAEGRRLDFAPSATRPFGGAFGAIGIDAAAAFRSQELFAEVTRTFDSQPSEGGFAAILRSVTDLRATEIAVAARYYDRGFANPYARPESAPDEFGGLRARDEVGVRVRSTTVTDSGLSVRTFGDLWTRLTEPGVRAHVYSRVDVALRRNWSWGGWASFRRSPDSRGVTATRVAYDHAGRLTLAAQLQHEWNFLGAGGALSHGVAAIVQAVARPFEALRLRARVRYDIDDIASRGRKAEIVWAYIDLAVTLYERSRVRVRYDVRGFTDRRPSTLAREPNPEHWLWLEYYVRF